MARVKRRPGIGRVTRYCVPVADAPAGPTVLLNADWSSDTILNDSDLAITNGDPVKSWAFATGGTATQALAVAGGADPQYLVWTTANGVHTSGLNAAVTLPSPITIPADTDCVIYALVKLQAASQIYAFGNSAAQGTRLELGGDGDISVYLTSGTGNQFYYYWGSAPITATLYRFRRSGSTWYAARTGDAEDVMTINSGSATVAIAFDTLLSCNAIGAGLTAFSATGDYLQKLYVYHGSSSPDTTYETNNGGVL